MSELERAKRKEAQAQWEVDHMTAWVEMERAKGRPESELTWGKLHPGNRRAHRGRKAH